MSHFVTRMEPMAYATLLDKMDPEVHRQIERLAHRPDVAGLVYFENVNLSSRHVGEAAVVAFGPGCTTKTLLGMADQHLGEVPSVFKHPVGYWLKPEHSGQEAELEAAYQQSTEGK